MTTFKTDLTGQQFGIYLVLNYNQELSNEKRKTYWTCKCTKCGHILNVRTDGLKRNPQSCPNCKNDLTGQKFGRLTVLKKGKIDKNGHAYWICLCECGNQVEVAGTNIIRGLTQSCGCLHKEICHNLFTDKNIIGKKFGKLTVLELLPGEITTGSIAKCKCECGKITYVTRKNLTSGHTQSCGCLRSKGEIKIRQLLDDNQITYATEYTFKDLPQRRFDFAIFNKDNQLVELIEYDGEQHFTYNATWYQNEEEFKKGQQRDKEKNEYCLKNHIKLLRIPYTSYNEFTFEDLFNDKYLIKQEDNDNAMSI